MKHHPGQDKRRTGLHRVGGEEFLYCVKAAGCAGGSAASGRACGLRPVPPYAAPTGNQRGILKSQIPYSGPLETCPAQGYHCGGPLTVNLHHFRLVSHTRL